MRVTCALIVFAVVVVLLVTPSAKAGSTTLADLPGKLEQQSGETDEIKQLIASLYADVTNSQWPDTVNYTYPLFWGHLKGRFPNDIHFNLVGGPLFQTLRNDLQFPDDNGFVDLFVLESLAVAGNYLPDVAPYNDTTFTLALESAFLNHDRYSPPDVPLFGFWPQKFIENVSGVGPKYEQWSDNLSALAVDQEGLDGVLKAILHDIGASILLTDLLQLLNGALNGLLKMFSIPMDSDDTGATLMLKRHMNDEELPMANALWKSKNYNNSKVYDVLLKYAYCPGSNETKSNTIDPRSYFWAREFLTNLSHEDKCLVTTWQTNLEEELLFYANLSTKPLMPFNVDNIDPSVCANALFSMSASFVLEGFEWLTASPKNQMLYETTAEFVSWALQNQLNQSRPDLEMLYYPPTVNLPSFVGRHLTWLESWKRANGGQSFPHESIQYVYELLANAARQGGTSYLEQKSNTDCSGFKCKTFWNGFLGLNDTTDLGQPTPHYDDRLFTSATALNGLFDAWTYTENEGQGHKKLLWLDEAPTSVKDMANASVSYLVEALNNSTTSYMNTFFSGSIHNLNTFPWEYPMTRIVELDSGSVYNCSNYTKGIFGMKPEVLLSVSGIIPPEEYSYWLHEGCAGFNTTTSWMGWNDPFSPWPFWSSQVLTKALAMEALSKHYALSKN